MSKDLNITPDYFLGWDIGGAHLKVVLLNVDGQVISSIQLACPLWKGLDFLQREILNALQALQIEPSRACHVITMTGELVDLFENRQQGVCEIAKSATDLLAKHTLFYAANIGFVPLKEVAAVTENIASTNWHASASALALNVQDALLVDIGSTTTDIIAIDGGKVSTRYLSDADRMQADSLVYTGVVRTPVMALAQKIHFKGAQTNVAAEYFATMADVYRLTGELLPEYDVAETADGKGKTALDSARRLARMIGHDVNNKDATTSLEEWIELAVTCRDLQIQQVKTAMLKQLKPNMTIIGAGAGCFLVKAIADDLGYNYVSAYKLISTRFTEHANSNNQHDIGLCFPAFAVAYLAIKHPLC